MNFMLINSLSKLNGKLMNMKLGVLDYSIFFFSVLIITLISTNKHPRQFYHLPLGKILCIYTILIIFSKIMNSAIR